MWLPSRHAGYKVRSYVCKRCGRRIDRGLDRFVWGGFTVRDILGMASMALLIVATLGMLLWAASRVGT